MDNVLFTRMFFSNYDRYIDIMENPFPIIVSKEIIEFKWISLVN